MITLERANLVRELARTAGFEGAGVAPAEPVARADYLRRWLDAGMAGEMAYLERWGELRCDPRHLLPGARSVIVVAHVYRQAEPGGRGPDAGNFGHDPKSRGPESKSRGPESKSRGLQPARPSGVDERRDASVAEGERRRGGEEEIERWSDGEIERQADRGTGGRVDAAMALQASCLKSYALRLAPHASSPTAHAASGRVARYAWGKDYHKLMRKKLHRLVDELRRAIPEPFEARVCVDTAPVLERELAAAAGIGWIGKNTMVLNEKLGSFFFLGEVITTLDLAPSLPAGDHCGTCTRCLDACPTNALIAPYRMDARRCISYLTIEHRGAIPEELQPMMGGWLYGCDICQDVCPYNRKAPATREPAYEAGSNPLTPLADLDALEAMTPEQYREALAGSAMKRASLEMLRRNAAVARRNVEGRREWPMTKSQ